MEDAKVKAIAGGCAGLAILGLGAVSLRARYGIRGRLRVVEQVNGARSGPQPGMPPGIYVRLETPESESSERFIDTHVVDATGVECPTSRAFDDYTWIPLGYKRSPRSPRFVADIMAFEPIQPPPSGVLKRNLGKNGPERVKVRELASVPLRDFPTPQETPLPLSKDAPFSLRRIGGKVMVEPIPGKMPAMGWELDVLATPYATMLSIPARYVQMVETGTGKRLRATEDGYPWTARSDSPELQLPYPQDTDAVKLRLRLDKPDERVDTVSIPGLRLVRRQGETVFDGPTPLRIPTRSGGGVVLRAPAAQRRTSKVDHRNPTLWVEYEPRDQTEKGPKPHIELVAPKPESLGLSGLTVGQTAVASRAPTGPVSDRPFAATLRLVWTTVRKVDLGVYTVPVR